MQVNFFEQHLNTSLSNKLQIGESVALVFFGAEAFAVVVVQIVVVEEKTHVTGFDAGEDDGLLLGVHFDEFFCGEGHLFEVEGCHDEPGDLITREPVAQAGRPVQCILKLLLLNLVSPSQQFIHLLNGLMRMPMLNEHSHQESISTLVPDELLFLGL